MLENLTLAFVGSGVMAEAMIGGLIRKRRDLPDVVAAGPREERGHALRDKYGIRTTTDNVEAVADADAVVLSVKPQTLGKVLTELRDRIKPEAVVLSIVAGARIATIAKALNHPAVVRSMPNTPAQIGEGITVWIASPSVTEAQRELARTLLDTLGQEILLDDEDYLDMATALSGTGPAYVFLFMEAMVDAGVQLGFPRRVAEQLVVQTVKGSVDYYNHSPNHLARLRNQVTSPGGTSSAALYYLEKAGFRTALSRAIWAAYQRSVELGTGKKRGGPLEDA